VDKKQADQKQTKKKKQPGAKDAGKKKRRDVGSLAGARPRSAGGYKEESESALNRGE